MFPVPPIAIKFGGYALAVVVALAAIRGHAKHHYKKGKADCETAQELADSAVVDEIPAIVQDFGQSNDQEKTERVEIHKTFHTGISQAEVELARSQGEIAGLKDGRKEVYDEIARNGGCLSIAYPDDSKLLNNARTIQGRLFKAGIGSYEGTETDEGLPVTDQSDALSDSLIGEYPKPD